MFVSPQTYTALYGARMTLTEEEAATLAALQAKAAEPDAPPGTAAEVAADVGAATVEAVADVAEAVAEAVADAVTDANREALAQVREEVHADDVTEIRAEDAADRAEEAAGVAVEAAVVAIEETAPDPAPADELAEPAAVETVGDEGESVVVVDAPTVDPEPAAVVVVDDAPADLGHWYTRKRGGLFGKWFS